MDSWRDVAPLAEFPPGTVRQLDFPDGTPVAVFHIGERFFAIEDVCSHEAETLSYGKVEGEEVVCPLHGARFSLATGAAVGPPAYEPVATFLVRIEAGMVQVDASGHD